LEREEKREIGKRKEWGGLIKFLEMFSGEENKA
jgi:hypothetical protein